MIVGADAKAIDEIVLLGTRRRLSDNTLRPVFTEIDKVLLLCNACEHGTCAIDYWIRGEENITECNPQVPSCKKCPQWTCASCCQGGESIPKPDSPYTEITIPIPLSVSSNVMIIEQDGKTFAIPVIEQ